MRNFILVVLCAGNCFFASAQVNSVLHLLNFGGASGSTTNSGTDQSQNSFNALIGLGYQVSKNWTFGGEINLSYSNNRSTYTYKDSTGSSTSITNSSKSLGYGGGLFARYSVPISKLLFFYTQADGIYTTTQSFENGTAVPGGANSHIGLSITPAIGLHLKKGYALNFTFGSVALFHNHNPSAGFTTTGITYNFGQTFTIGVSRNTYRPVRVASKPIEDMGGGSSND